MVEHPQVEHPQFYLDDVVFLGGRVGLIIKTAWEEDNEDDDDEEDEEEEDNNNENNSESSSSVDSTDDTSDVSSTGSLSSSAPPPPLAPSHARILWLTSANITNRNTKSRYSFPFYSETSDSDCSDLEVIDRSFLHGDVVVLTSNRTGQLGTVTDVKIMCQLTFADGSVIDNINSHCLSPIHPYQPGAYVTYGRYHSLYGYVESAQVDLTIKFSDGGICIIKGANNNNVKDAAGEGWGRSRTGGGGETHIPSAAETSLVVGITETTTNVSDHNYDGNNNDNNVETDSYDDNDVEIEYDSNDHYYPAQRVIARSHIWRRAEWITGNRHSASRDQNIGTVINVTPIEITVDWMSGNEKSINMMKSKVCKPEELNVFEVFPHAKWILGDTAIITPQQREEVRNSSRSINSSDRSISTRPVNIGRSRVAADDFAHYCGLITRTHTLVSVLWQDGSRSNEVDSISMIPKSDVLDNDFVPNDYVLYRGSSRLAYVKSVSSSHRTALIEFLPIIADNVRRSESDTTLTELSDQPNPNVEQEVSVLDLIAHPYLELSLGSIVLRIPGHADIENNILHPVAGTAGYISCMRGDGLLQVNWCTGDTSLVEADQIVTNKIKYKLSHQL